MTRRELASIAAISITVSVAVSATMLTLRADPLPCPQYAPPVTVLDATGGR